MNKTAVFLAVFTIALLAITMSAQQPNVTVTLSTGNGVTGTGSPRVTIASDNTAFSVNNTQQGTASDNLAQWAATALGTPTNFGTTPGAVVAGSVNSSLFMGTVAAVAGNGVSGTGVQRVTLASDGTGVVRLTDGTTNTNVIASNNALKVDASFAGGTALANTQIGNNLNGAGDSTAAPSVAAWAGAYNGTNGSAVRTASLANLATSQTATARNSAGAILVEQPSRYASFSNPAAGSQASLVWAAEVSVRHVADVVCFSAAATTAPALTALTINLRDGASGAGTVLMTWQVAATVGVGQQVAPYCSPPLGAVGTTNTAMTIEFSASLANLLEAVSLTGHNVN